MFLATSYHDQANSMTAATTLPTVANDIEQILPAAAHQMLRSLEKALDQSFAVIECTTGEVRRNSTNCPPFDLEARLTACAQIVRHGRPEILDEVSPVVLLAVPIIDTTSDDLLLAIAPFATLAAESEAEIAAASKEFGVDSTQMFEWAMTQNVWRSQTLIDVSAAIVEKTALVQSTAQLKRQMADISSHLLMTFEEITLLHRLTEHLSISESVTDICELSVNWLGDVIPAKSVAIWFESFGHADGQRTLGQTTDGRATLVAHGSCPL